MSAEKNPHAVELGRLGGKWKGRKGFADPRVLAKALETRRRNREKRT